MPLINQYFAVLFWATPRSGFDVVKKNVIMNLFREVMMSTSPTDQVSKERFDLFEKKNDGLVIYEEVIETDLENPDVESDIMPVIKSKHPSAKYIAMMPVSA